MKEFGFLVIHSFCDDFFCDEKWRKFTYMGFKNDLLGQFYSNLDRQRKMMRGFLYIQKKNICSDFDGFMRYLLYLLALL